MTRLPQSRARRFFRGVGLFVCVLAVGIGLRGVWLAASAPAPGDAVWNERADASLRWLSLSGLEAHADAMQSLFPEGRVFTAALTGLAWAEVGRARTPNRAKLAARNALTVVEDSASLAAFGPAAGTPHGMFYHAWSVRLMAAVLEIPTRSASSEDTLVRARLAAPCEHLATAFAADVFPDSYPGQAWPADAAVGGAALAACGRLLDPTYGVAARGWLDRAKAFEDPEIGLWPHAAGGAVVRGSSSALVIPFVAEIDPVYADTLYRRFDRTFATRMLGVIPAVREYPRGFTGRGDIDSGPVVLGAGAPASVVGIAAALSVGDADGATRLRASSEALGFPVQWSGGRRYAGGLLPVGDAFLAWSSTRPLDGVAPDVPPRPWRLRWILASLALAAVGGAGIWRSRRRRQFAGRNSRVAVP